MRKIPFIIQDPKIIDEIQYNDGLCFEEKKKHYYFMEKLKKLKESNEGLSPKDVEKWKAIRIRIQELEKKIHDTIEKSYKQALGISD